MKIDRIILTDDSMKDELNLARRFWKKAFLIYALLEIIILAIQYFITWEKCKVCVLPPAFYPVNWIQHLLFTALLWLFLNRNYYVNKWKLVALNVIAFIAYYFLWIATSYLIINADYNWLTWESIPYRSVRWVVYGSWSEIGKIVLKFSAFYVLKFYSEYRRSELQRTKLAVINKDIQLNLLKQQLNPHFYFNTLNNLYGLARSNSKKLYDAIRQLNNIMQYVIIDCNKSKVSLQEEISFLQSYIALEKLRYEKNTVIEMQVQGDAANKTIVPLLLIQFVENAFKHGMKEKSENNWVKINMQITGHEILYTVNNSLYATTPSRGIGINSVNHILNLQYEDKHSITMAHEDNCFSVTLKLNLL